MGNKTEIFMASGRVGFMAGVEIEMGAKDTKER